MAKFPPVLDRLIREFSRLPGIGPKSAERLAFHSLNRSEIEAKQFGDALLAVVRDLGYCARCHGLAEGELCDICASPRRDGTRLCVVEQARDVFVFERSGIYDGLYHVLGGVISPLDGVHPEDLHVEDLKERVIANSVQEVIVATNASTEGETTGLYLARLLAPLGVAVSRIAYGLPVGGELEYSDPVTLARALEGRRKI